MEILGLGCSALDLLGFVSCAGCGAGVVFASSHSAARSRSQCRRSRAAIPPTSPSSFHRSRRFSRRTIPISSFGIAAWPCSRRFGRLHDVGRCGWWRSLILTGAVLLWLMAWWAPPGGARARPTVSCPPARGPEFEGHCGVGPSPHGDSAADAGGYRKSGPWRPLNSSHTSRQRSRLLPIGALPMRCGYCTSFMSQPSGSSMSHSRNTKVDP